MSEHESVDFRNLLTKVRGGHLLTPAEAQAWEAILATKGGEEALAAELRTDVDTLAPLLRFCAARSAQVPEISPEQLRQLVEEQTHASAGRDQTSMRRAITPRRVWPWGLVAAMMVMSVGLWWWRDSQSQSVQTFEFAWIAGNGSTLRGGDGAWVPPPGIVAAPQANLSDLRAWAESMPSARAARLWIDDDRGVLCVRWRDRDGNTHAEEEAIASTPTELHAQLNRWKVKLSR